MQKCYSNFYDLSTISNYSLFTIFWEEKNIFTVNNTHQYYFKNCHKRGREVNICIVILSSEYFP